MGNEIKIADGISVTYLKPIRNEKGDLYHVLKACEQSFFGFGEAYFTTIKKDKIKGWKKHTKMHMNLVVPIGSVTFYLYDEVLLENYCVTLGDGNYGRLSVAPNFWMAFKGNASQPNLILNIASIEHDPGEVINASLETYPILESN